jgi:hypothetical protein
MERKPSGERMVTAVKKYPGVQHNRNRVEVAQPENSGR